MIMNGSLFILFHISANRKGKMKKTTKSFLHFDVSSLKYMNRFMSEYHDHE